MKARSRTGRVMSSRHLRKLDDQALQVGLTSMMVDQEVMGEALPELISGVKRFSLIITRSQRGRTRSGAKRMRPHLVLNEPDLDLSSGLDPRLIDSREAILYLETNDGGFANIRLTPSRSCDVLAPSPEIKERIAAFDAKLRAGRRGRPYFSAEWALAAVTFPFWAALVVAGATAFTFELASLPSLPRESEAWPDWLQVTLGGLFLAWPFTAIAGAFTFVTLLRSGGLGLWPQSFSVESAAQLWYRFRTSKFLPQLGNTVVIAAVSAAVTVLVTNWLNR